MESACVYPGSFDPVTTGHLDIIARAASIFDRVTVAVLRNTGKRGLFSVPQRMDMLARVVAPYPNVTVDAFDGLLVDYMAKRGARVVLRGLRAVTDFESEFQMAQLNHQMAPDIETLFLMTSPETGYISSSAVREIASFGGDISAFVPACIADEVARACAPRPTL